MSIPKLVFFSAFITSFAFAQSFVSGQTTLVKATKAHENIHGVTFSPDGKYVFSAGSEGLKHWDAKTGELIHGSTFDFPNWGYPNSINSIAVSSNKSLVYLGTNTQEVQVWNYEKREVVGSIPTRNRLHKCVEALAISPDGKILAIAENGSDLKRRFGSQADEKDYTILLWNTESESEIVRLTGHAREISSLMFSSDGRQLLSISNEGCAAWDLNSNKISSHVGTIHAGKYWATTQSRQWLAVWDDPNGQSDSISQLEISGSKTGFRVIDFVRAKFFAPKGGKILQAKESGVLVIDVATGERIQHFQQFTNSCKVRHVAISPDGSMAVSAGDGHSRRGGFGSNIDHSHRNLCFWRINK